MATELNKIKSQGSSNLLAQTMINLQNISVITLRMGKQVQGLEGAQQDADKEDKVTPSD